MKQLISSGCRVVVLTLVVPLAAAAQQPSQPPPNDLSGKSLEELMSLDIESVTGAARHKQRVTEAPASVTIITANDIETFGWRTLAEVLGSVRGFHVTYDRNYAYLGVRAFGRPTDYNNRILIQVDGHRVNDVIYDAGSIGTELPIDLSVVDRIEVIRGPGSALYGTSAFFGVVNIITKRGASQRAQLNVSAGSLDAYRTTGSFGWSDGAARDVLLSVGRTITGGQEMLYYPEFDRPEENFGQAVDLDRDASTTVYAAGSLGAWRFQSLVGTRAKSVPTASWSTRFNDPRYETVDTRGWLDLTYQRQVGNASVTARGYYDHYRYSGIYPYQELDEVVLADDGAHADWLGSELTARQTVWGRHALTAGVEYRFNPRQQQSYLYGEEVLVDDRRRSSEVAGYLQDEIAMTPRWTAILGARYDWWSHKGGTGRPRAGLIFRTDYDTAFKVLYGEAYRAPNLYELYYGTQVDGSVANRDLRPESLRTTEVVIEQYFQGRVRVAMSAFYTRIHDLIDQVTTDEGAVTHTNQESVRARGVELEAEGRWPSGLLVRGSFTAQDADPKGADEMLSNAPHKLATLQVALPVWRRQVQLASETSFVSERKNVLLEPLPGYWLSNVTATWRPVGSRFTVGASIYNVFDATYLHPVGAEFVQAAIAQDGRTASVRATVKF